MDHTHIPEPIQLPDLDIPTHNWSQKNDTFMILANLICFLFD